MKVRLNGAQFYYKERQANPLDLEADAQFRSRAQLNTVLMAEFEAQKYV